MKSRVVKETEAYIRVRAWLKENGCERWFTTLGGTLRINFIKSHPAYRAETYTICFKPNDFVGLDEFLREHRYDVTSYQWVGQIERPP